MRAETYELKQQEDVMRFEFTSVGPKGEIPKLVLYQETNIENLYNLAFGDKNKETGEIDDIVVTNNSDSQKVLATVAYTVYLFTEKYPNTVIGATGSTKARTRLYRMGVSNHLEEILADFDVFGTKNRELFLFEKNTEYDAIFIKRKYNKNER